MKKVQGEYIGGYVGGKTTRDIRPWGMFEVLDVGRQYKVKRLIIDPDQSISYQYHKHRGEHWFIVRGVATIKLGESGEVPKTFELNKGGSIDIKPGTRHQLANLGTTPLILIEVQTGAYLEEDDIIRLEDPYNR